ncbi:hypothetical protein BXZ70DRAFT_905419 [Cristinia sonorae]|uniref:Uncharacterized protein n=1 Tax=Cristinia sonorae TaxID=1940300 RepID=A0A8K0XSC3_9AGAR|nr:hypothetical protein BXZ70DRAFT_905419 [Cristinia sonorae]
MSSGPEPTGQGRSGLSPGVLGLAIAIPVIVGLSIIIAVPFIVVYFKNRKKRRADASRKDSAAERGLRGHRSTASEVSESGRPLLREDSPPQTLMRSLAASPMPPTSYGLPDVDHASQPRLPRIILDDPVSNEKYASTPPALQPPFLSPPLVNKIAYTMPLTVPPHRRNRESSTPAIISKPASVDTTTTTDLLHRPSFLTKPRSVPPVPGTADRPDMRSTLLTRMTTNKSIKRSLSEDDTLSISPVSLYSQPSLKRGDTHKVFPKRTRRASAADSDIPPVPALPPNLDTVAANQIQYPILQDRLFRDDTALPVTPTSALDPSRDRSWFPHSSPSSSTSHSPSTAPLDLPPRKRCLSTKPRDAPEGFHAMPEYGVVLQEPEPEKGRVLVSAWSEGRGREVVREVRRLPPTPQNSGGETLASGGRLNVNMFFITRDTVCKVMAKQRQQED